VSRAERSPTAPVALSGPTSGSSKVEAQTVPVFRPLLEAEELTAATEALELGWLGMGSYVAEFERAVASFVEAGERHVAAVSTGHAALHLGLLVAGVGPGDEVITPSFNNVTDFQAILATGAEPVFCDIRDDTLCIDVDRARELVTPRTKALIAMDYASSLCDHEQVQALAEHHDLRVIHDAAHSFGSAWRGRMVGSFSDMTMFSFDPVKTITSIDGGALVVRTAEELELLQEMRLVGMGQPSSLMYRNERAWTYDVRTIGYRYHLANLHAAIGLAQINKIGRIGETRRRAARGLSARLRTVPQVRVPPGDFEDTTPFLYYVRVAADERQPLREHLTLHGIDTGIHWQPGHRFSLFRHAHRGPLEVTDRVADEILSLPLHSEMDEQTVARVADGVASFYEDGR